MLITLELRWFCRGTPPIEVEHWFSADCLGQLQESVEEREDLYLYTPECDYLNIKLRQGNLEVKWRKAELGIRRFNPSWEGKVEQWLKWSCEDPTKQSIIAADLIGKRPWVAVKKRRRQRRFAVQRSQPLYQTLSCELTELNVKSDRWWSVACEMATEDANQIDEFENLVSQVSQTYQGLELLAENSYAYPRWLSVLSGLTNGHHIE